MKTHEEWMYEKIGWLGEKEVTCSADEIKEAINAARKEAIEEAAMIATEGANDILKLIEDLK